MAVAVGTTPNFVGGWLLFMIGVLGWGRDDGICSHLAMALPAWN